ncbi:MAG: hypothetical protein ACI92O_000380 [Colwellia sp.]|jgi:hypothetical protein
MPGDPWETLGYIPNLVKNLKKDFSITPYQYKSSTAPGSNKLFQNFQWVKNDSIKIARCAQPGYKSHDEEHGFIMNSE